MGGGTSRHTMSLRLRTTTQFKIRVPSEDVGARCGDVGVNGNTLAAQHARLQPHMRLARVQLQLWENSLVELKKSGDDS